MLQSIRDKAQGWFAWVIVSLLILVFAVWGIGSYFAPDPNPLILDVNGQETHYREFQRELTETRQRLRESLGSRYDERLFPLELLQAQVIERFINDALLRDMASENGMRVGDAQLAAAIRGYQAFQADGQFSADRYRQVLGYQGLSEAGFEERLRSSETVSQVENGIQSTDFATPVEVTRGLELLDQTRSLAHLAFSAAQFVDGIEISEQEIEQYYQDHQDRFSNPERVVVDYLDLDLNTLAAKVSVPEDQLKQRYEDGKETFTAAETRKTRHILIELAGDADDAAVAAAEQKLAVIQQRLAAGEAFEVVAKDSSDDAGSAASGGDLGFFGRGAMVPAFEEAAFALPLNTVSEPVRSPFGYHLIEVTEIRGGETRPFSEVRAELLAEMQMQEAEQQFYDFGELLANESYEQPDSLEPAAEAVGLKVQSVGPFARGEGEGIATEQAFEDAAFRADLISSGTNSEPLELGPTRIVVLRIAEHQPATPKPLAEVRAEVEQQVRQAESAKEAKRLGAALLAELKGGADPEKLAVEHGREWVQDGNIARTDKTLAGEVRQTLFSMALPQPGSSGSFAGTETANGDFMLLWLTKVTNGATDAADPVKREQMSTTLARLRGKAEFDALLAWLRDQADIKVFKENIP